MEVALYVLLAIAVVGVIVWIAVRQHRQVVANLTALAERQGLRLHGDTGSFASSPEVAGERHGRRVRLWTYATGSGKSRRNWAAAGVEPRRSWPLVFELQPQGIFSKLSEIFGGKEIQVGDRVFDEQWFVRASLPEEFRAALLPEIREKFIAAHAAGVRGVFKLEEGWVCYVESGSFHSEATLKRLEQLLPLLHDLADIAEVCAGPEQPPKNR